MQTDDKRDNRSKLARTRAGLSIEQAAQMLGVGRVELDILEHMAAASLEHMPGGRPGGIAKRMAKVYQVRLEWLLGHVPLRDYDTLRSIPGSDDLSGHDRDVIAEFISAMPRARGRRG